MNAIVTPYAFDRCDHYDRCDHCDRCDRACLYRAVRYCMRACVSACKRVPMIHFTSYVFEAMLRQSTACMCLQAAARARAEKAIRTAEKLDAQMKGVALATSTLKSPSPTPRSAAPSASGGAGGSAKPSKVGGRSGGGGPGGFSREEVAALVATSTINGERCVQRTRANQPAHIACQPTRARMLGQRTVQANLFRAQCRP
jgi:hypothetical protein